MSDTATAAAVPATDGALRYRRVLLKLSGEALLGDRPYGVDPKFCAFIAAQIAEVHRLGVQVGLVVGGGNIFRGMAAAARGMDRATGDYIGMLATVMNGLALQDALEKAGVPTRVMTAIAMNEVAEPYIRRRAIRHLEKGRVTLFVAGTGNPYFTTDTAAALRAVEINADVLLKATKVDGVYDRDPMTDAGARRYAQLGYADLLRDQLKVMDAAAVSLCMENDLPDRRLRPQPARQHHAGRGRRAGRHPHLERHDGLDEHRRCASMTSEILADADHKMARAIDAMERDFQGVRTGRASTSLVERITVDYYGTQTPLNQLAGISVPEPHQIVIQPWDRGVLGAIEKAITKSEIGLMPNVDGTVVRLEHPAVDRGTSQGPGQGRPQAYGRGARGDPQHPARYRRSAQEGRAGRRRRLGRVASPARHPAEDDRPAHRRGRSPRRSQGTGGPRGLVARAPLARPTDAPPSAHEPTASDPTTTPAAAGTDDELLVPVEDLPRHVAIIMDGNRRWARAHHLSELEGHAAGVEAIRGLLRHAVRRGVPVLTLYAFSRENWARSDDEVSGLFHLLEDAIRSETDRAQAAQGVRVRLLGRVEELPDDTRRSIGGALDATSEGARLLLNIAFNYAGRTELVDAIRRLVASGLEPEQIDEATVSGRALHGRACPTPTSSSAPVASNGCRIS